MSTNRWIPVIAAAWLAAATACSDSVAPTDRGSPTTAGQQASQISIVGIVHQTTDLQRPFTLSTDDGQEIALVGANLASVARIDRAVVEVRGAWNADGGLDVNDFVVRSVEGEPAMDGILIARYDETGQDLMPGTLIGYALQLTRGGTIALTDPPADLISHLGERVWVTGDPTEAPAAFGFIQ